MTDAVLAMDSSLVGIGAFSQNRFFHSQVPEEFTNKQEYCIAHFELMAIIIALKVWGPSYRGQRFVLHCDNQAVVEVIHNGTARDKGMQELLRQFAFQCAIGEFEVVAMHLMGALNRVPDLLSRWTLGSHIREQFEQIRSPHWQEVRVDRTMWLMEEIW